MLSLRDLYEKGWQEARQDFMKYYNLKYMDELTDTEDEDFINELKSRQLCYIRPTYRAKINKSELKLFKAKFLRFEGIKFVIKANRRERIVNFVDLAFTYNPYDKKTEYEKWKKWKGEIVSLDPRYSIKDSHLY